jgi:hypothetical protein
MLGLNKKGTVAIILAVLNLFLGETGMEALGGTEAVAQGFQVVLATLLALYAVLNKTKD